MLFNSKEFLIFFPVVVLLYYAIPLRLRYIWLLAASYFFYMCWNAKYALLLLFSTAVTFISGILIERIRKKAYTSDISTRKQKYVVALSVTLNLLVLFVFKYLNFTIDVLQKVFMSVNVELNVPEFDIILPVGISFFTFQALSYTMDIYRGEIYAEKNFFRYALFVSFFPQLVAGPIERSKNLLRQLDCSAKPSTDRMKSGFLLMLWGYFLKLVIADRVAVFVDTVYGDYSAYPGAYCLVATLLFAVQIYCDFSGYSTIAMGAAQILGIRLMENFDAPYLSTSVAAFWRRWHISLTSWFKDYLYIPLGGNQRGKGRSLVNRMIVFVLSGLWHGADLSFVAWGAINGLYQIGGELLAPLRDKLVSMFGLNRRSAGHKMAQVVCTFLLVDLSWIFFRAETIADALSIARSIAAMENPWILMDGSLYHCGLDSKNFGLMIACIGVLFIADMARRRGIVIRDMIAIQDGWFQMITVVVAVTAILLFGVWGGQYDATNFIYFQF